MKDLVRRKSRSPSTGRGEDHTRLDIESNGVKSNSETTLGEIEKDQKVSSRASLPRPINERGIVNAHSNADEAKTSTSDLRS